MTQATFILAEGFPPQLLIGALFVAFWVLSSVFGKAGEKADSRGARPPTSNAKSLQSTRERMASNMRAVDVGDSRKPGTRGQGKSQPKRVKQQAAAVAKTALAPVQSVGAAPRPLATPVSPSIAPRQGQADAARNVRLLLQCGGAREAFLLAEVLGPPKSSR